MKVSLLKRHLRSVPAVCALCLAPASGVAADAVAAALQQRVEQMMFNAEYEVQGVPMLAREGLAEFYAAREYRPAWRSVEEMSQLLELAEFAYSEGLDPDDFPLEEAAALVPEDLSLPADPGVAADLELLATESLIRMAYQLRFGKVNPNGIFSAWNFRRELEDDEKRQILEEAIAADSLVQYLDDWLPRGSIYENLKKGLAKYRAIQSAGGWQPVPEGATLRQGDTDARIPALRSRLLASGDLAPAADATSGQFDAELDAAVARFQARHDLDADGVVGRNTYAALNVPLTRRIDQLRASLERVRWAFDEIQLVSDKAIVVNIASAEVAVLAEPDGRALFRARAQVGKPYRQTPVFKGDLQYLQVAPTWTVPPTILRKDVLPKLKADALGYLESKNMDLLTQDGTIVDPATVDFSQIGARGFPYIVRQRPGPWNALGQIKFIFPNSHFVFLHDTPSRALFERAERTFSSGCIRVERPFELAELVLDDPEWDRDSLKALVDAQAPRNLHLKTPMPVFLIYWTAMVEEDGTVRFPPDVYGRDEKLLEAMNAPPLIDLAPAA